MTLGLVILMVLQEGSVLARWLLSAAMRERVGAVHLPVYEVGEMDGCGFGTENVRAGKAGLVGRMD
jgi:hypothetical protein